MARRVNLHDQGKFGKEIDGIAGSDHLAIYGVTQIYLAQGGIYGNTTINSGSIDAQLLKLYER